MPQPGSYAGLVHEHLEDPRVGREELGVDELDRDLALEAVRPLLDSVVHGGHAPLADRAQESVPAETVTGGGLSHETRV